MKKLIVEVWKNTGLKQIESTDVPAGMMLVEGVIGRVDSMNRNKRFYPKGEYQKHVDEMTNRIAESNGILGEMEHPKSMSINLNNVSHKMMEVRIDEDGFVKGKILLLDTPKGLIAQSIVRSGTPLPISSRGIGQTSNEGAVTLEYMSTYDLVGTAGFAETGLHPVSESLDENGKLISEMYEYILDDKGNAIEESSFKGIVEAVEQRLSARFENVLKNVMTSENASEMIAEHFTKNVEQLQSFVTEGTDGNAKPEKTDENSALTKEKVLEMLNEHFINVQIPIIEKWSTNHLLVKNAEIQEAWLKEVFTKELCEGFEKWMFESVLPKNAEIQEAWLKEVFAKELCEGIENWTTGDFAQKFGSVLEQWVTGDFAPKFASITESYFKDNAIIVAKTVTESESDVPGVDNIEYNEKVKPGDKKPEAEKDNVEMDEGANCDDKDKVEGGKSKTEGDKSKTVEESAKITHKSEVLGKIDAIIAEALSAKSQPAAIVENANNIDTNKQIDEASFKFGPAWITNMPNRFKHIWECLDETQKSVIRRRASVRIMNTNEDIANFWNTLNITNEMLQLKAGSNAYKRDVKQVITENANPRAHLVELAKSMQ